MLNSTASVLITDDDEAVRISLKVHFEDEGYSVSTASSAEESLVIMDKQWFDIAVIDLRLPVMDGMDLIREAHSRWPRMGFIIHTGSIEYDLADDIIALPQVSKKIFIKPVSDLKIFSKEAEQLMIGKEVGHEK